MIQDSRPRATGAFLVAPLAGPIEFSTGEVILILAVVFALSLGIPVLAGVLGILLYRRHTPEAERTGRGQMLVFLKWGAITFVAQFVLAWAIGGIASFT